MYAIKRTTAKGVTYWACAGMWVKGSEYSARFPTPNNAWRHVLHNQWDDDKKAIIDIVEVK